jgi:primary-amine oxidase
VRLAEDRKGSWESGHSGADGSRGRRFGVRVVAVALLPLWAGLGRPAAVAHPLDPLSRQEIAVAAATLRQAGDADRTTRFALIDLDEPKKAAVLAWRPGRPLARRAAVVARLGQTVYEGIVDLSHRRVVRWDAVRGVESRILAQEWVAAQQITRRDAGWQAAMRRRGYNPATAALFCAPLSAGFSANPKEAGRRLLRVTCFDTTGTRNVWGRPIEGLVAVVDLDAKRVVRLLEGGPVPVGRTADRFPGSARPAAAPARPAAETPAHFTIAGNVVRWEHWSFHYRMDPRSGLVLSLVRYADRGRERLVLYRGSLSEMSVPYMDPDPAWSFRTYLDVGEWGFGRLSSRLVPGIDCPTDARFLNATLANARGEAIEHRSVICLFERRTGAPLWRHAEIVNGDYQGRPAVDFVIRTIPALGNYDYVLDWVLTEDGAIRLDVGATGIDQVKGVRTRNMLAPTAQEDTRYGVLIAPNRVGVNHDHFVSVRLDVDIDGQNNTLVRQRLVRRRVAGTGGRRSLWRATDQAVAKEGPLDTAEAGDAERWLIENPNMRNALGQHPAYELRAEGTATSLLAASDVAQRRAAFSAHSLWVTAYDPRQLYAAGRYPNQSRGGRGLPAYVEAQRRVRNADIVLWCTLGFHHVPRPEDWPVMATERRSLALVPDGFFDHNPAVDARQDASAPVSQEQGNRP